MKHPNITIAEKWFAAFNTHNLEELLSLYHDSAEHFSPKLKLRLPESGGWVKGKPALQSWWQDAFDRLPELQYTPMSFTANEERVVMEYIRAVPGEADMRVAEFLEISDGLIHASRVYHG